MTPIVLLHAYPLDRRMWDAQAEYLARIGRTVIAPDYGGFGDSQVPDPPTLAGMAAQVLSHIHEPAIFAGCSMGGYVLMEVIRQRPDLVAGAVFIDTKATADNEQARANRERVAERVAAAGQTTGLAQDMLPLLLGETTRAQQPTVVDAVRTWIEGADPAAAAAAQLAMAQRPDSREDLSRFEGPALVVWGSQDTISPASEQEEFFSVMPQAVGREIAGCGHLPSVEAPAALNDILLEVISDWAG